MSIDEDEVQVQLADAAGSVFSKILAACSRGTKRQSCIILSTTELELKIFNVQNLMPEGLLEWNPSFAWHERENLHYVVVREPRLYRTYSDDSGSLGGTKFGKKTTWLKNSTGWFCSEKTGTLAITSEPKSLHH